MSSSLKCKSVVVVVFLFGSVVYGQPWVGSGDANDPYQIWTAEDMRAIGANPGYWEAHFELMADIDLGAYTGTSYDMIGRMLLGRPESMALDLVGGKMYWTDSGFNQIQRANIDGTEVEDLVTTGLGDPSGIAVDSASGKVYWTDWTTGKIQRANLDGTEVEDVVKGRLVGPTSIALDVAAGKMYWADGDRQKIERSNLDGTEIENVVTTGLIYPYAIALDVAGGKIYWTDCYKSKIWRANLDGTEVEDVLTTVWSNPCGLALDLVNNKMYWTDTETDMIHRANLNGMNMEDLRTEPSGPYNIAIDSAGGKMYWTGFWSGSIHRATLDATEVHTIIDNYFTGVFDGGGHTISNFTYDSNGVEDVGLFGLIYYPDTEIKNVGLIGANISAGGGYCIGSLAGYVHSGTISGCYVEEGNVTGEHRVGGLVGHNNKGYISNCYSTGGVAGEDRVGGLVGYNYLGDITSCHSTAEVLGSSGTGGLVGVGGGTVVNSFWDTETSGQIDSAGGTGLTTAEMQDPDTFISAGWDFVDESVNGDLDIWRLCNEGAEYPQLNWQYSLGDFGCPDGVDMFDFAVLGDAWMSEAGELNWDAGCDIFEPEDEVIDGLDLGVFVGNWLEGVD